MRSQKRYLSYFFTTGLSIFFHICMPLNALSMIDDLTELSLEALMDIEITTASRKAERLGDAASAVFVITSEDIRRSGALVIPELLRMVPGLQVARVDAGTWAITARGFNGRYANKLLVLIDGRTVYAPSHSGVYWDMQDTLLEDVERIEVIRGPGASLWGANAVNGVINIITKSTVDTQGGLVTAGIGSEVRGLTSMRYGGTIGEDAFYRIYGKYTDHDNYVDQSGLDTPDSWDIQQGGFRVDWPQWQDKKITIQGDVFSGDSGHRLTLPSLSSPPLYKQIVDGDISSAGGNIIARLQMNPAADTELILKTYYDHFEREERVFQETRDTIDIDFQYRFIPAENHELTWGLGYRYTTDNIVNTYYLTITPDKSEDHLFSAFVQDDISIIPEKLSLTLGSKLEHNDYTGVEIQPTARLLWTPNHSQTYWASVSRAVRTPSRVENDGLLRSTILPSTPPVLIEIYGSDEYDSEEIISYEMGHRSSWSDKISFDTALFFNTYDNLRTGEPLAPYAGTPPTYIIQPYLTQNKMTGESMGAELVFDWYVQDWWRLEAGYNYFKLWLHLDEDSNDIISEGKEDQSPQNQVSLRSFMTFSENVELDLWWRFIDKLTNLSVDSYSTIDIRLAWKPLTSLELSVVGQNVFDDQHQEFWAEVFVSPPVQIERSIYAKMLWTF